MPEDPTPGEGGAPAEGAGDKPDPTAPPSGKPKRRSRARRRYLKDLSPDEQTRIIGLIGTANDSTICTDFKITEGLLRKLKAMKLDQERGKGKPDMEKPKPDEIEPPKPADVKKPDAKTADARAKAKAGRDQLAALARAQKGKGKKSSKGRILGLVLIGAFVAFLVLLVGKGKLKVPKRKPKKEEPEGPERYEGDLAKKMGLEGQVVK